MKELAIREECNIPRNASTQGTCNASTARNSRRLGHLGATPLFGIQPGAWHSSNNQVQSGECHFLSALHEFFQLLWRVGVCAQMRAQTIGDSTRDHYKVVVLLEQFEFLVSTTRLPITKSKAKKQANPSSDIPQHTRDLSSSTQVSRCGLVQPS